MRDKETGYSASSDYWIRCLYEGEEGNLEDVEKGFLKSKLLVKVCLHGLSGSCALTANLDRRSNSYSHHHPQRRNHIVTHETPAQKDTNIPRWAVRSGQIMQRNMGWTVA